MKYVRLNCAWRKSVKHLVTLWSVQSQTVKNLCMEFILFPKKIQCGVCDIHGVHLFM
jgi:hypothetical protein